MSAKFISTAATTMAEVIGNLKPDQLTAPTPCAEFDVRTLLNHLLFWGPSLVGAGRKELVAPPAAAESDVDLTEDDWAAAMRTHLDAAVAAWSDPAALAGTTRMGGNLELPADLVGGMLVGELVVHGWDLAKATGQIPEWDQDLAEYVHDQVSRSVEQGREMGVYGPPVELAGGTALDRALALSGRDPSWRP